MTHLKEPPVPEQKARGAMPMIRTTPPTEELIRGLTRTLAVELNRTPTQDEVVRAAVMVATVHMPLLVKYLERDT